jgi:hypothetical protein
MARRKVKRLRLQKTLKVPVKGKDVRIHIDQDIDLDRQDLGPIKTRCEGPNGLKTGSVVDMLQKLGLSQAEIGELRRKGILDRWDFNNIGARWEPWEPELYYDEPDRPAVLTPAELSRPLEDTLDDLAHFDQVPPDKALETLERVKRRLEWEALKEQSREEIAWFLENLDKANSATRCAHIKPDGSACRAPAIKGENFCHWHTQTSGLRRETKQPGQVEIPVLEDRVGIQLGIMRVCDLLTSKAIDPYTARVLFQGLRLAERTLNRENFLPPSPDLWKAAELAGRKNAHEQD